MKTFIKLLLFAAICNGAYHVGSAYFVHYSFRDAVQELVQFRGDKDDAWVRNRIIDLSLKYDVPVDPGAVDINSERYHTLITIGYKRQIELFPGVKREWPFMMNIDALGLK